MRNALAISTPKCLKDLKTVKVSDNKIISFMKKSPFVTSNQVNQEGKHKIVKVCNQEMPL